MAFAAILGEAAGDIAANPGSKGGGLKGFLSRGDTTPGSQYAAFRPGGMFAPPTPTQTFDAFKGKNTLQTLATVLGGVGLFGQLVGGPGKGQLRRKEARTLVDQSPALLRLQQAVRGAPDIMPALAAYLPQDPEAAAALQAVASIGGSARSRDQQIADDILKYVLLGETVTKRAKPSVEQLATLFGGATSPSPLAATEPSRTAPAKDFLTGGGRGDVLGFSEAAQEARPVGIVNDVAGAVTGVSSLLTAVLTRQKGPTGGMYGMPAPLVLAQNAGQVYDPDAGVLQEAQDYATDVVSGVSGGAAALRMLQSPYRRSAAGRAVAKTFVLANPVSGAEEWFGPYGKPKGWTKVTVRKRRCHRKGR
jgi:hypothetical protein